MPQFAASPPLYDRYQQVANLLLEQGYAVTPAFFSPVLVHALKRELLWRDRDGQFHDAGIGRGERFRRLDDIRGDRICWLQGEGAAQQQLAVEMERLRLAVNRTLMLGLFDIESHFAIYEPGAWYQRHLDTFRDDARRQLSVVIYLNDNWQPTDGGELRLWADKKTLEPLANIAPQSGTLVCFLSRRIPHQVCIAHRERYSIAAWCRRRG